MIQQPQSTTTVLASPTELVTGWPKRIVAAVLFTATIAGASVVLGQEPTPRLAPAPSYSDAPAAALSQQIESLIQSTEEARRRLRAKEQSFETAGEAASGGQSPTSDGPKVSVPSANSDASRKVTEIRERLRILQRFRDDRLTEQQAAQSRAEVPQWNPPPETASMRPAEANKQLDQQVAPALRTNADQSIDDESAEPSTEESPERISGERLLPEAVDSFALGESLYRTGNYESALKALRAANTEGMSQSERTWLDLIIALCERKTGAYEKAEGAFRDIANTKSKDYPVQVAKWWLKYAESDHESKTKLESLETEIELLFERSRSHVSPE